MVSIVLVGKGTTHREDGERAEVESMPEGSSPDELKEVPGGERIPG